MTIAWKAKSIVLATTSCILVVPSSAFLFPIPFTARGHQQTKQAPLLLSKPNEPGDWFESEPSEVRNFGGGSSLMPQQLDPFGSGRRPTPTHEESRRNTQRQRQQQQRNQIKLDQGNHNDDIFDSSKFHRYDKKLDGNLLEGDDGVSYYPRKPSRSSSQPNRSRAENREVRRPTLPTNIPDSTTRRAQGAVVEDRPREERRPNLPNMTPLSDPYQQWKSDEDRPGAGSRLSDPNVAVEAKSQENGETRKAQAMRNAERMRAMYQMGMEQDFRVPDSPSSREARQEEKTTRGDVVRRPTLPNVSFQARRNTDTLLSLHQQTMDSRDTSPVSASGTSYPHESNWDDWQQTTAPATTTSTSTQSTLGGYDMYNDNYDDEIQKPNFPQMTSQAKKNVDQLRALYQQRPEEPLYYQQRPNEEDWVNARARRNGRSDRQPDTSAAREDYRTTGDSPPRRTVQQSQPQSQILPLDGYYMVDRSTLEPEEAWRTEASKYDDDEDDYYDDDEQDNSSAAWRTDMPKHGIDDEDEEDYYRYEEDERFVRFEQETAQAAPTTRSGQQSRLNFREPQRIREPMPSYRQPAYSSSDGGRAYERNQQRDDRVEQTMSSSSAPFQIKRETIKRYSTAPMGPPLQELRQQQQVPMATIQERGPPPDLADFPMPRGSAGAIMPLEPLGGPLGGPPAAFWWGNKRKEWYEGAGRTSSIGQHEQRQPGPYLDGFRGDEVVQGGSRKTFSTSHQDQTIVELGSKGRPIFATAQVWQGPGNTPASMSLYSEDGGLGPWRAAFQNTDRGTSSSVLDIRNDGPMEFPLEANVLGKHDGTKGMGKEEKDFVERMEQGYDYKPSKYKVTQTVQGQSLKYFNVKAGVAAVMVELHSEGRPMFVQVELWKGPNAVKQAAEVYSDNGSDRHWSAIIDTHGQECTVAIRNVGPALVYPIKASVDPIPAPVPY